jgi:hypothetical protein
MNIANTLVPRGPIVVVFAAIYDFEGISIHHHHRPTAMDSDELCLPGESLNEEPRDYGDPIHYA